jgi:hypothetical protein
MYEENTLNREKVALSITFLVQNRKFPLPRPLPMLGWDWLKYHITQLSLSALCNEGRGIAFISCIAGVGANF